MSSNDALDKFGQVIKNIKNLHETIAKSHPTLERGKVWCTTCGRSLEVSSAHCLRNGWPACCGYTMTLDSPEERKKMKEEKDAL